MNKISFMLLATMLLPTTGWSAPATETALSCVDFRVKPEALDRFPNLKGACEAVVERDGELYGRFTAVVRRSGNRSLTLYLPATDHTFTVEPERDARVLVGGNKVRPRDLTRGQEIRIHLAVNAFARPDIEEIAFVTDAEILVPHPVTTVRALPTTASPWPVIGLSSLLLLMLGGVLRRYRLAKIGGLR